MANNVKVTVSPINFTIALRENTEVTCVLHDTIQSVNQIIDSTYGSGPVQISI